MSTCDAGIIILSQDVRFNIHFRRRAFKTQGGILESMGNNIHCKGIGMLVYHGQAYSVYGHRALWNNKFQKFRFKSYFKAEIAAFMALSADKPKAVYMPGNKMAAEPVSHLQGTLYIYFFTNTSLA